MLFNTHTRARVCNTQVLGPNHQEVGSALQGLGGYIMSGDNMDRFKVRMNNFKQGSIVEWGLVVHAGTLGAVVFGQEMAIILTGYGVCIA